MRLTSKELHLIIGAIDTHECELIEQDQEDAGFHTAELRDLDKLSYKIATELIRRGEWVNPHDQEIKEE